MKRLFKFWKVLLFDLVGVTLMLLAIATGWLPGPGGIPLFIIGLSILAIHHEWAQKYIDKIKGYAENIGKHIFSDNKNIQLAYDVICPVLVAAGIFLLWHRNAVWQITLGVFLVITGITLLAGNRKRFHSIRQMFRKKHKNK
jgi:hypothetical protein